MASPSDVTAPSTRVTLRPIATPLPLGFLGLALASASFAAVQLGWVPVEQTWIAGLTAIVATMPLQFVASLYGFHARDAVASTGMGVQAGTWGTVGIATLLTPQPGNQPGLGVLMVTAGIALLVPTVAGHAKLAPAAVLALAGIHFVVLGVYELTGAQTWGTAAASLGLLLAAVALYAALALELEAQEGRQVLPVGRRGQAEKAAHGEVPMGASDLSHEPGVRPQL